MSESHLFRSALAVPILQYIAEKRAVGHKFTKGASLLKRFDSFVHNRGLLETELTMSLVVEWTARKPNETISTQSGRISLLRGLANYMTRIGYKAYVIAKSIVTIQRNTYIPYIFSNAELKRVFEACDRMPFQKDTPNRQHMLTLLIRMLYGCGLRISEALHLTLSDVDLDKGTLFIRKTKFNKERILPMADHLISRCREYCNAVHARTTKNPFFFPSLNGGHYTSSTIYKLFRDLLRKVGISHLGRGKGPRIHDLRHTFAVNCLKKWVLEGKDLNNALPYLSVYLGHEDMRGSQRYLRLTADLYPELTTKIEKLSEFVVPEVKWNEVD